MSDIVVYVEKDIEEFQIMGKSLFDSGSVLLGTMSELDKPQKVGGISTG